MPTRSAEETKPTKPAKREVFSWSPLAEVAYEARFDPILSIEREVDKFQGEIRHAFPTVKVAEVPEVKQRMWEFETRGADTKLRVSTFAFGAISTRYRSFDDFSPLIETYQRRFFELYGIDAVQRITLRYVNNYSSMQRDSQSALEEYARFFALDIDTAHFGLSGLQTYRFEAKTAHGQNYMAVRSGILPGEKRGPPAYVLDLEAYRVGEVPVIDLPSALVALHDMISTEFRNHIKDPFVNLMRSSPPFKVA